MIQILHNPRCTKSRCGIQFLKNKNIEFQEILYLENPLKKEEIITILKKLGIKPFDWVRKTEEIYKTSYKGRTLSDDEWIDVLVQYPKLIERPVIINGNKAVIGRPAENIASIL